MIAQDEYQSIVVTREDDDYTTDLEQFADYLELTLRIDVARGSFSQEDLPYRPGEDGPLTRLLWKRGEDHPAGVVDGEFGVAQREDHVPPQHADDPDALTPAVEPELPGQVAIDEPTEPEPVEPNAGDGHSAGGPIDGGLGGFSASQLAALTGRDDDPFTPGLEDGPATAPADEGTPAAE